MRLNHGWQHAIIPRELEGGWPMTERLRTPRPPAKICWLCPSIPPECFDVIELARCRFCKREDGSVLLMQKQVSKSLSDKWLSR